MLGFTKTVICSVLLAAYANAAPAPAVSSASVATSASVVTSDASSSAFTTEASSTSISVSSTGTSSAAAATETVPYASDDPNAPLWNENSTTTPQAERGTLGATIMGPHNVPIELQNPDFLAPPSTDSGSV